jgi:Putative prokaryotic signal transducing protein
VTEKWALLRTVYSGLEADTIRTTLEIEGIPVLVRGYQVGMWGSAFQGPISEGADVLVPESALERARELVPDEEDEEP